MNITGIIEQFDRVEIEGTYINRCQNGKILFGFTETGVSLSNLARVTEVREEDILQLKQIHGDIIFFDHEFEPGGGSRVETNGAGNCYQKEGDGIILTQKDTLAVIRTADCVPLFFWTAEQDCCGVLHVGRQGLLNSIELKLLKRLDEITPRSAIPSLADLYFYMGPAIEQSCYEVGSEILDEFKGKTYSDKIFQSLGNGKYLMDIKKGILLSLCSAGIAPGQIFSSSLCTYCEPTRLPSYRRDKKTGRRMYNFIKTS